MSEQDNLGRLAELAGVARRYRDTYGQEVETPREGLGAVLASLGYEVENEARIAASLSHAQHRLNWLVRPTITVEASQPVAVPLANIGGGDVEWHVLLEDGSVREGRDALHFENGRAILRLEALPEGYHRLGLLTNGHRSAAYVISAPPRCYLPERLSRGERGFGITAQVYGLKSARNFGIGDFTDVGDLAAGAGASGASFLGLSPVHCLFPADRTKISPYSPSSRLFIDPFFIDPEQVPGFATSPAALDFDSEDLRAQLAQLRAMPLVDHQRVWALKSKLLNKLWLSFLQGRDDGFSAFREAAGEPLELHATFEALSEKFQRDGLHWSGQWPANFRDSQGEAVKRFRREHPRAVAFHAWLQWLADSQLGAAQIRAINSGMPIGLYRDLAVGVDGGGAEMWARPDWFLRGLSVGAPPDPLGPAGQNWGLPPVNPATLEEQGLAAFRTLLSANMRHAGAIRIDHAFQLQRLFVIPEGMPSSHGAYIDYPFEAMLAAIRLESKRARAIVIAEDLGTAPEGFSEAIMRSDLLSYRILNFEREHEGRFKPPSAYPRKALAAVATHDLPSFAGWWQGLDISMRESLKAITPEKAKDERANRKQERARFAEALVAEKILPSDAALAGVPFMEASLYLARSPAMLVALQLEDILGDTNQANVPGSDFGHPNWRRKLTADVDTIAAPNGPLSQLANVMDQAGRVRGASAPTPAPAPAAAPSPAPTAPVPLVASPAPAPQKAPPVSSPATGDPTHHGHAAEPGFTMGRVVIENVTPELNGGLHAAKAAVGQTLRVEATIFTDGHEKIAADLLWRRADETEWTRVPMKFIENDRWFAICTPQVNGPHRYTIEAWRDPFASLRDGMVKKRAAGQKLGIEAGEAVALVAEATPAPGQDGIHKSLLDNLQHASVGSDAQLDLIVAPRTQAFMDRAGPRHQVSRYPRELNLWVDRKAALYSSWYELFPRSVTSDPNQHGTFRNVIGHLPYVRDLGFDVLYFPPINPIGLKNRKGKNNTLTPAPDDPGSVYAIGSQDGGHDAIHPELGTIEDFRALVTAARDHGLEIALDFAIQCSPDHPWIKQHPEWFVWRSDGTIQYAENPPKRYEDIVNVEFYNPGSLPSLWEALRDAVLFWVREGVRILRVDNPHTKPIPFWRWMIAEVNRDYPDVIFLAEAFTRPAMMKQLAKVGFQQSYTYFTWRNEKWEIEQYMRELTGEMADYYRPNFFVNTPDINPHYLQTSGRPGFLVRATLAATLSSSWGVYSGFELCEAQALPGREEYLDSEKYEVRVWDFDRPGNIRDYIRTLNKIRHENAVLHDFRNLTLLTTTNEHVISYAKFAPDLSYAILVIVNLDPHNRQDCGYEIPLWEWGLPDSGHIDVEDLIGGYKFPLFGKTHQLALDPAERSAVIWRLQPPADWKGQT